MKKILKITVIILGFFIVILVATVTLEQYKKYDAPYPKIHALKDTATLRRGKYLVTALGHCADCHSSAKDYDLVNLGKVISLSGGKLFKLPIGTMQAPNITQDEETGIGSLTDSQIARALRYGVGHDGRALFPFMNYQNLTDKDLTAVVSYLRTLAPVKNKIIIRNFNTLGYIANAFFIKPVGPEQIPATDLRSDTTAKYGKYLALSVSGCRDCHTNRDLQTGAFIGPENAGGFHMESETDPDHYECITPNLTPDKSTGRLTNWSKKIFISRFKAGKLIKHSPMPWGPFKAIKNEDLTAIYNYLKSLKPIHNPVTNTLIKLKK